MKYFELKVDLFLKYDIEHRKSYEPLSKMVSSALNNTSFKELHNENRFKHYVFSNMWKTSKDGIYKKGNNLFFLRTPDEKLFSELGKALFDYENDIFKITGVSKSIHSQRFISSLISVTPVFTTFSKNRKVYFWTLQEDGNINYLLKTIHNNLKKKYESFYGNKIDTKDSFIEYFQIKNQKPQTIFYKSVKFFGNKFYIVPKSDEASQKLAFMALSCGLGEKNALGGGFCKGFGKV
ncbi:CRISPR-associated endoribonuclease Cas6 [Nitrosophilus alvini]|uniref:CRISPR-associated endoribonuclease Cas6 n=1 Tax=Nitrosophilus alvini TaxID=2714855 RepID=UPI00190D6165|nr:CRISPR-associated endoribonuclease Cas6 [Nitrosophilus alvini]